MAGGQLKGAKMRVFKHTYNSTKKKAALLKDKWSYQISKIQIEFINHYKALKRSFIWLQSGNSSSIRLEMA